MHGAMPVAANSLSNWLSGARIEEQAAILSPIIEVKQLAD